MTQEHLEKCKTYEKELKWAVKSNFVHMTSAQFSEIVALYTDLYGESLTPSQQKCNTCRLKALKRIGGDFFAQVQETAQEQKQERQEEKEEAPAPAPEKKKPVGRKKSLDIS